MARERVAVIARETVVVRAKERAVDPAREGRVALSPREAAKKVFFNCPLKLNGRRNFLFIKLKKYLFSLMAGSDPPPS